MINSIPVTIRDVWRGHAEVAPIDSAKAQYHGT